MTHRAADQPHDDLEVKIWPMLGGAVQCLEHSWDAGVSIALAELVPDPGHPFRRRTLLELVKVDQELRWQSGDHRLLESYLSAWPELSSDPELVAELLDGECLTRASLDQLPTAEELATRFPEIAPQIDLAEVARRASDEADKPRKWRILERGRASAVDGTSPAVNEPPPLEIGQQFGRYAVKSLLGGGGMGWVYHVYDTVLERDVALKIPRFAQGTNCALLEQFLRESRAAARIEHPNICAVYDAGDINGVYYLTMRRVRGQSLAQRLQRGPLEPLEAAGLTHKLALALSAVHDHGTLHRDIKTSNILLDEAGEPLLTDFGLASLPRVVPAAAYQPMAPGSGTLQAAIDTQVEPNTAPVNTSVPSTQLTTPLMGTIHYLAPELFQNQAADVRSDVYSLGVVLYRMLAGCLPFAGQRHEVVDAIEQRVPPPPSRFEPEIPSELEAICLKAMARQPADRYQSAADLAAALTRWLEAKHFPSRRMRRGVRMVGSMMGAVAVALLAMLIYYKTGLGTVVINMQDSHAELTLDGDVLTLDVGQQAVRVSVGEHKLEIIREGGRVETRAVVIRWRGERLQLSIEPALASSVPVAIGWGLPRCDLEGTRFYPVATKVRLEDLSFATSWSAQGDDALTGDIDGDGSLELVVSDGATLTAYRFASTAGNRLAPECVWKQPNLGHLNLVTNVTGSAACEIITSGGEGDQLILRVLGANGQLLNTMNTSGEIASKTTRFNPKATIYAVAVADLQQDGDKEIIAVKNMEGETSKTRGPIWFDYTTGQELKFHSIGPMVGDLSVGKFNTVNIVHATIGPDNDASGKDGSVDNRSYVFMWYGLTGRNWWRRCFDGEGMSRSNVGLSDLDGDGSLDIVASSYRWLGSDWGEPEPKPAWDLSRVYLLDPADGSTRPGYGRDFHTGVEYCGIADFDGDGTKDVLIRMLNAEPHGDSLAVLRSEPGLPDLYTHRCDDLAVQPCAINDINGDGKPEIIATASVLRAQPPVSAVCVLASDLTELCRWQTSDPLGNAIVSDLDGDGINEIIVKHDNKISVLVRTAPAQ